MTREKRVVITGFGLHGGHGDQDASWQALCDENSAIRPVSLPSAPGFPELWGVPAAPVDLGPWLPDRKLEKYMSLATRLAVAAAGRALESAGLLEDKSSRQDMALFVTTGLIAFDLGSMSRMLVKEALQEQGARLDPGWMGSKGLRLCHPLMPFKMLLNMPLGLVSQVFGIGGENFINYPGSDQVGVSLEVALRGIRQGRFSRALVGGCAQGLELMPLSHLVRQGLVCPDQPDQGWAVADQAAFLVLESEEKAQERGIQPICEIESALVRHKPVVPAMEASPGGGGDPGTRISGPRCQSDTQCCIAAGRIPPGGNDWLSGQDAGLILSTGARETSGALSFDALLGYGLASALPATLGFAGFVLSKESLPAWLPKPRERLEVYSAAPGEASVRVVLRRATGTEDPLQ